VSDHVLTYKKNISGLPLAEYNQTRMASKPKKSKVKPPSGRPTSTSQLSQPVVEGSSTLTSLSAFSSEGNLFAFISLAIDKHRLRVYDTTSGRSVAEQIVDASRVTTLAWRKVDLSEGKSSVEDISPSPLKKKRKNRKSLVGDTPTDVVEVVLLGLSNGELLMFSPSHGRTLRTLSHPSSRSAILSVEATDRPTTIWTSSADGAIRRWDAQKNNISGIWKTDDRIPYSSMAVRPGFAQEDQDGRVDIVCANHGIHLLSMPAADEVDISEVRKPKELASFTGHASSVTGLHWASSQKPANRFLSTAEGDRFVSIWEVPITKTGSGKDGKIVASIPLDSDARSISLSVSQSTAERQCLLALSASGKLSVYPIPSELTQPASSHKTPDKIPTLLSRSNTSLSFKKNVAPVQVVAASFAIGDPGRIHVARIVGGARPVFDVVVSQCTYIIWPDMHS
jgi:U3 small nucleolar RNA-associated protein 5